MWIIYDNTGTAAATLICEKISIFFQKQHKRDKAQTQQPVEWCVQMRRK